MLETFDDASENISVGVLLLQTIPYYKLNCIEIGSEAKCKRLNQFLLCLNLKQ